MNIQKIIISSICIIKDVETSFTKENYQCVFCRVKRSRTRVKETEIHTPVKVIQINYFGRMAKQKSLVYNEKVNLILVKMCES